MATGLAIACRSTPKRVQMRFSGARSPGLTSVTIRNAVAPPSSQAPVRLPSQSAQIPKIATSKDNVRPNRRLDGGSRRLSACKVSCQPSVDAAMSDIGSLDVLQKYEEWAGSFNRLQALTPQTQVTVCGRCLSHAGFETMIA